MIAQTARIDSATMLTSLVRILNRLRIISASDWNLGIKTVSFSSLPIVKAEEIRLVSTRRCSGSPQNGAWAGVRARGEVAPSALRFFGADESMTGDALRDQAGLVLF